MSFGINNIKNTKVISLIKEKALNNNKLLKLLTLLIQKYHCENT